MYGGLVFTVTQNATTGSEKMRATSLLGVLLQLALFTTGIDAFCSPRQLGRSPDSRHHNGFPVEALRLQQYNSDIESFIRDL
jgi:hypothetical protein